MIDYITWGGFPLRFSFTKESDIKRYLEQTYEGILDKDIITDRSKVNRQNFERVATYIMANAGKEFSSKNIENYFIHQNADTLDKKTIYRYLDKMEKACLIDRVKRFNIVGKQAMSYIEKQYAVDTGFRMINTNLVNFEDTFFLENIIYNELKARDYEVFTGKTYKGEIDFVAINGRKKCFIQVAYYLAGKATIEREFGAFKPISDASPKYVFSLDRFDYSRDGIAHINIVDFLLGKKDINLS
ncbi:MAG: ATP-binding protein [Lachnospira eligens]